MKKKTRLSTTLALMLMIVFITSCEKNYNCECKRTYTKSNGDTYTESDGNYTFKDTRVRAKSRCNEQEGSGSNLYGTYTRDCELK